MLNFTVDVFYGTNDDFIHKILFIEMHSNSCIPIMLSRNLVECNRTAAPYVGPRDVIDNGLAGDPRLCCVLCMHSK